ncbi:MAG: hypothetical protein JXA42_07170 [Anaerolineales bacterium]|nr:hypothetical protein [Anaerolineales bacterium]
MKSDDKCYHCNTPVPEMEQFEQKEVEFNLSAFIRYSIFVLLLIIFGLYLMSWMGRNSQPPSMPTPEAWIEQAIVIQPAIPAETLPTCFSQGYR